MTDRIRWEKKLKDEFNKFMDERYKERDQNPIIVKGLTTNIKRQKRAQKGKQPVCQSARRKVTDKLGGVAIDLLKKSNERKRDDEDDRRLFEEIEDVTDTESEEKGQPRRHPHT